MYSIRRTKPNCQPFPPYLFDLFTSAVNPVVFVATSVTTRFPDQMKKHHRQ